MGLSMEMPGGGVIFFSGSHHRNILGHHRPSLLTEAQIRAIEAIEAIIAAAWRNPCRACVMTEEGE